MDARECVLHRVLLRLKVTWMTKVVSSRGVAHVALVGVHVRGVGESATRRQPLLVLLMLVVDLWSKSGGWGVVSWFGIGVHRLTLTSFFRLHKI